MDITRRDFIYKTMMLSTAFTMLPLTSCTKKIAFKPLQSSNSQNHKITEGYNVQTIISWGDDLFSNAKFNNPAKNFGYNNDYTAFFPLPKNSNNSNHGLLFVNHEFVTKELMFKNKTLDNNNIKETMDSHGFSVIEIKNNKLIVNSKYNRRITTNSSVIFSGAAANSHRLSLNKKGTIANCAGGITPWGTALTAEENFNFYFSNLEKSNPEYSNYSKLGLGVDFYNWAKIDPRFDLKKDSKQANNFGWIVEHNPYDPNFIPIKRTSLGRFKHECANCYLNKDGKIIIYSGDDEANQHIYRFITSKEFDKNNHNPNILDDGILYVAKFINKTKIKWIELSLNNAKLRKYFTSEADILIETRRAANIVGATPLDRPEDIEVNPQTAELFVCLTKNPPKNKYGHILRLQAPDGDHSSEFFSWEIFLKGGKELANPDNIAFDPQGNLWICTDGQEKSIKQNNAIYAIIDRKPRKFFTAPKGAEITGPTFTPDGRTLFLSIQHPSEGQKYHMNAWPDWKNNLPPRPSVIAITKNDGGIIGS